MKFAFGFGFPCLVRLSLITSFPAYLLQCPAGRNDPLAGAFFYSSALIAPVHQSVIKGLARAAEFMQFKDAQRCLIYHGCAFALCCCHDSAKLPRF